MILAKVIMVLLASSVVLAAPVDRGGKFTAIQASPRRAVIKPSVVNPIPRKASIGNPSTERTNKVVGKPLARKASIGKSGSRTH